MEFGRLAPLENNDDPFIGHNIASEELEEASVWMRRAKLTVGLV